MSDGATFSWFAFFMNGTHGEMTRFSGNAIPMRRGNDPAKWKAPGRLRRFFFSALKHELRNTTDISFFMISFVLYNVSFFMFPSCFSVLNVLIQAYTVLFRCKNILNRFIIRVTLNGAYKILYEIFQCETLRSMCHRNVCWKGSPFCWEGFLILYYGISVSGFAKKDCRSTS